MKWFFIVKKLKTNNKLSVDKMATPYKVEVELTSDWINLSTEEVENRIKTIIEDTHPLLMKEFRVTSIKAVKQ